MPGAFLGKQVSKQEKHQQIGHCNNHVRQKHPQGFRLHGGKGLFQHPAKGVQREAQPQKAKEQQSRLQGGDRGLLPVNQLQQLFCLWVALFGLPFDLGLREKIHGGLSRGVKGGERQAHKSEYDSENQYTVRIGWHEKINPFQKTVKRLRRCPAFCFLFYPKARRMSNRGGAICQKVDKTLLLWLYMVGKKC